jgi:hypothetical protein
MGACSSYTPERAVRSAADAHLSAVTPSSAMQCGPASYRSSNSSPSAASRLIVLAQKPQ